LGQWGTGLSILKQHVKKKGKRRLKENTLPSRERKSGKKTLVSKKEEE